MNPMSRCGWVGISAAILVAAAAACSQQTTGPTSSAFSSAAADALTNPDVPVFSVPSGETSLGGGTGPCAFTPSTGQFGCPEGRGDGLTVTRTVTDRDAAGNIQPKFDAQTTASITTDTTATGTRNTPGGGTATIDQSGEMVVTGLAGTETTRTLNGQEHGTVVASSTLKDGTMLTLNSTEDDTTTNLVVPVADRSAGTPQAFPLSGSRTHSDTTVITGGPKSGTTTLVRTETYDGSGIAQVDITQNGVTRHCTVDLTSKTNNCGR